MQGHIDEIEEAGELHSWACQQRGDREPIAARERDVAEHRVVVDRARGGQAGVPVGGEVDDEARLGVPLTEVCGRLRLILHDQNLHT